MPNPNLPINARYNTYIGARYVPKFAEPTEWSAQNKYDPLTIVTYQGNSYTSKTFVAEGIAPTDETYWAATGNYNSQVEMYRQEVLAYSQFYKNKVSPMMAKLVFPKFIQNTDPEGSCAFYVFKEGHAILFDAGVAENSSEIIESLNKNGVTHLDAVVISHYHVDHVGGLMYLTSFIDNNTTFYLPQVSTRFPETSTERNKIVSQYGTSTFVYPEENSTYEIDEEKLTFINCGIATTAYWDSTQLNYNNYSMVTYLGHLDTTVMFMGDIEVNAQTRIYQNKQYRNVQLLTSPHHTSQELANSDLALCLAPQYVYSNDAYLNGKWLGYRDLFICTCGSLGAQLYENSTSFDDVEFNITPIGIVPPTGALNYLRGAWGGNHIHYQVDSNADAGLANGSIQFPFLTLEDAFGHMNPGFSYSVDVVSADSSKEIFVENFSAVEIIVPANVVLGNITLRKCSNMTIRGAKPTLGSITMNGCSDIVLYNINPLYVRINEGSCFCNTVFPTMNAGGPQNGAFVIMNSNVRLSGCGTSGTIPTGIYAANSIISNDSPIANWNNTTQVFNAFSSCVLPTLRSSGEILKKIYGPSGTYFGFDDVANKAVMFTNGVMHHIDLAD